MVRRKAGPTFSSDAFLPSSAWSTQAVSMLSSSLSSSSSLISARNESLAQAQIPPVLALVLVGWFGHMEVKTVLVEKGTSQRFQCWIFEKDNM